MSSPKIPSAASKSVQDQRKEKESDKESHAEDDLAVGTSPNKGQPKLSNCVTADHEGATPKFERDILLVTDVSNIETVQRSEDWLQVYEKETETTTQPMNQENLKEREPNVDTDNGSLYDTLDFNLKQLGQETITSNRSHIALASALPECTEVETGQSANQGIDNPEEESGTGQTANYGNQGIDSPEEESDTGQTANHGNQGIDSPEEESDANQGIDSLEEESDTGQTANYGNQGIDSPEEESDTGQTANHGNQGIDSPEEESDANQGIDSLEEEPDTGQTANHSNKGIGSPEEEYSLLKDEKAHAVAADNEITVYKKEIAEQCCREMGYKDEQIRQAKQKYQENRDPRDCYSGKDLAEIMMKREEEEREEEEREEGSYKTVATVRDSGHPGCHGSSHKIEVEVPLKKCDCCDKQEISCKFVNI